MSTTLLLLIVFPHHRVACEDFGMPWRAQLRKAQAHTIDKGGEARPAAAEQPVLLLRVGLHLMTQHPAQQTAALGTHVQQNIGNLDPGLHAKASDQASVDQRA
jgi:hypothetical protein